MYASMADGSHHDVILDSINEGVFTVDLEWRITSMNRAAESILGVRREDAAGHLCREVFNASICERRCALKQAIETGRPVMDVRIFVVDSEGERIPVKISAAVLHDERGRGIGGVETFQDLRQVEELRKRLRDKHTLGDIVGRSPAVTRLFSILPRVAESESSVLIEGASGTGKELFARAIHDLSPRRDGPFMAVNCAALPESLLESELFGHRAGAFTGATSDKPGRFSAAHGGTLLLDEIGDISPAVQTRLLRVLEQRSFEPLGSVEPVHVDVRVVAATNRDLSRLVAEGRFREDLFYRIHVVHLTVPPLVERREDIPLLVERFIGELCRLQGRDVSGLSPRALSALMEHDYPGNVRELRNVIEHAFALCTGPTIRLEHLPATMRGREADGDLPDDPGLDLRAMERRLVQRALEKHAGNRRRAARDLGIDASTLYRKIRRLGIPAGPTDGRHRRRG
jgi:PAS domain S-box-containing protein